MKQYFLLLCMICCLFVISCADESAKTGASYEAEVSDNTFCFPSSRICETEEAYYGVGSGEIQYIQFMDKKSRVSGVLCGKSECEHNDAECNAYVGIDARGFCVYNERIYWVGDQPTDNGLDSAIWSIDLDGNNRRRIKTVDVALQNETSGNSIVHVYQNMLFMAGTSGDISEGEPKQKAVIQATRLDSSEEWLEILEVETSGGINLDVKTAHNALYIMVCLFEEDGIRLDIYRWSIEENELTLLFTEDNLSTGFKNIWVTDRIYLSSISVSDQENNRKIGLYQYSLETSTLEPCFELEDLNYQWVQVADQVFLTAAWDEEMHMTLYAKDFSGNEICQKAFDVAGIEDAESYARLFLGGNREHIFYTLYNKPLQYTIEMPLEDTTLGSILWESNVMQQANS